MSSKLALAAACLSLLLLLATRCASQEGYEKARRQMVEQHLKGRDIRDRQVLEAMGKVPRHEFVPLALRSRAYADHALPIGQGQTISQPYVVALMTQLAELSGADVVLEVGTGSGYQAAMLAEIVSHVYTVEIIPALAKKAKLRRDPRNRRRAFRSKAPHRAARARWLSRHSRRTPERDSKSSPNRTASRRKYEDGGDSSRPLRTNGARPSPMIFGSCDAMDQLIF